MHQPAEKEAKSFNAIMMKELIMQKMKKNNHFEHSNIFEKKPKLFVAKTANNKRIRQLEPLREDLQSNDKVFSSFAFYRKGNDCSFSREESDLESKERDRLL